MAPAWESVSTMAFENSSALGSDLLATTVFRSVAVTALEAFALDRAFRSHSLAARTPAQHLLAARLDAAHGELVQTDLEGGASVAEIAARWGFAERSLTRTHVEVYGVRPQDLLGR